MDDIYNDIRGDYKFHSFILIVLALLMLLLIVLLMLLLVLLMFLPVIVIVIVIVTKVPKPSPSTHAGIIITKGFHFITSSFMILHKPYFFNTRCIKRLTAALYC